MSERIAKLKRIIEHEPCENVYKECEGCPCIDLCLEFHGKLEPFEIAQIKLSALLRRGEK